MSDGSSSDDDAYRSPPEPLALKEQGNEAYRRGATDLALELWRQGLKALLKESVRGLVREGQVEMCTTFRLNMAQALIKQEQWVEALDQLEVVLNQEPDNLKALYRQAQVQLSLQEFEKCEKTAERGLEVDANNPALRQLLVEVSRARATHNEKSKKVFSKMFKPHKDAGVDRRTDAGLDSSDPKCTDTLMTEVDLDAVVSWEGEGHSDDPQSELWTETHSGLSLHSDEGKRPLVLSLPFTVLRAIEKCLASAETESDAQFWRKFARKETLTIHAIGVRGDVEMECMWSAILQRMPKLKSLALLCIGFMDETDHWGMRLSEGKLSPPLSKEIPLTEKHLTCQLFKGHYQLFTKLHPGVLSDDSHPYHPDVVVVAEPSFSRHFDSWIPAVAEIIKNNIFCTMTGYSAVEIDSHEAVNIPPVLKALEANVILPIQRNAYAVKIQPDADMPPMPCFRGYGKDPLLYSGPSAKNAVFCAFRGSLSAAGGAIAPTAPEEVARLKDELRRSDVDVDVGEKAMCEFREHVHTSQAEKRQ